MDAIRKLLRKASDSPAVLKADTSGQPVMHIAMQSARRPERELQSLATNIVQPRWSRPPMSAPSRSHRERSREIRVSVPADRLAAYGITISQLAQAIGNANVNVASGFIQSGSQYYNVRLIGEFASVSEIRNLKLNFAGTSASGTTVSAGGGSAVSATGAAPVSTGSASTATNQVIALSDIATVLDTGSEKTEDAFLNGQPSIGIDVLKTTDGNTLAAVAGVKAQLQKLGKILPPDITFTISTDQSETVNSNLNDVVVSLMLGALLAILIVFIFLHNIRGTIILHCHSDLDDRDIYPDVRAWLHAEHAVAFRIVAGSRHSRRRLDCRLGKHQPAPRHGRGAPRRGHQRALRDRLRGDHPDLRGPRRLPAYRLHGGVIGEFFRSFGITVAFATLFSLLSRSR